MSQEHCSTCGWGYQRKDGPWAMHTAELCVARLKWIKDSSLEDIPVVYEDDPKRKVRWVKHAQSRSR